MAETNTTQDNLQNIMVGFDGTMAMIATAAKVYGGQQVMYSLHHFPRSQRLETVKKKVFLLSCFYSQSLIFALTLL